MGRRIDWFLVSVATFLCGCAVALTFSMFSSRPIPEIDELPLAVELPQGPKADDFAPEFFDLPNFGDVGPEHQLEIAELIMMFDDGIYRTSEVVAKPGQSWLILTKDGNKYSLQNSLASVKQLRSVSWPGDENDAKLDFGVKGKAIFAVRNISGLKPGNVTTVFHANPDSESDPKTGEISDGFHRAFELGDNRYVLRVSRGLTEDGEKAAVFVLESGGVNQVIKQVPAAISPDRNIIGSLIWAGDVDHDGKLDLSVNEFNEKGATLVDLYLSTKAVRGKLVGFAAGFGTAGC